MDITPRMLWFLNCLDRALMGAESALETVLRQGRFWQRLTGISINERQRLLLNKLLDGFEGKLTTSK